MNEAKTSGNMSPGLRRVVERARRNPHERQFALAYLIDVDALRRAYHRLRKDAAVGVDGVTKEEYGREPGREPPGLARTAEGDEVPPSTDPPGPHPKGQEPDAPDRDISATEDKIVQGALREILEAIYEQDFLDCSHGFRPGRKPMMR